MPTFAPYTIIDLVVVIAFFLSVWLFRHVSDWLLAGIIFICFGILCFITKTVTFRYYVLHRGTLAFIFGIGYITYGLYLLISQGKKNGQKGKK